MRIARPRGGYGEAWLALPAWLALGAVLTWPAVRHPATTVPADLGDPLLQAWQLAWDGHALLHQPTRFFDANTFWPLPNSLGFSDSLSGLAPLSWVGAGPTAALVRYNLAFVAAYALCGWGAYLLARQLGLSRLPATVAGAIFTAAPWRASQAGHLQILSCYAVPLALALLARGHGLGARDGPDPARRRPGLALLGWAVAAWQLTLGFGIGLQWAYLLGAGGLGCLLRCGVTWWRAGRPAVPRPLLVADAGGALLVGVVGLLWGLPYLRAVRDHPEARRTLAEIDFFSPPLRGLWTTPATNALWGPHQAGARAALPYAGEATLALGATAVVLAVLGVVAARAWSWRRRALLAGAAVTVLVFALGTRGPAGGRFTYLVLFDHAPGFAGIRTPGRLVVVATLLLALLAAAGAEAALRWVTRVAAWRAPGVAVGLGLVLLVLTEGVSRLDHPRPAPPPTRALHTGSGPLLVLPTDGFTDETTMWWSTDGFPPLVNGTSGFTPTLTQAVRDDASLFPTSEGVRRLRAVGIRRVVVVLSAYDPAGQQQLLAGPLPGGVRRVVVAAEGAVVFLL